jgi:hypothetical protein
MAEKLTWEQIKELYNEEWVELVEYDWPDESPDPTAGVVRVHAKTREEFDRLTDINPPWDAAIVYVGELFPTDALFHGHSVVIFDPP